jgi:hypothetical protein
MGDDEARICVSTHVERASAELTVRVLRERGIEAAVIPTDDELVEGEMVWMVAVRPEDRDTASAIEDAVIIGKPLVEFPDGSQELA